MRFLAIYMLLFEWNFVYFRYLVEVFPSADMLQKLIRNIRQTLFCIYRGYFDYRRKFTLLGNLGMIVRLMTSV